MRRWGTFAVMPAVLLAGAFLAGPIAQPPAYHGFADGRTLYDIPNFANVATNFAFVLFGWLGFRYCLANRPDGALSAWTFFFLAFMLVGLGSAYYHLAPSNPALVWDRLAMTLAFAGLYVALMGEYVSDRLERILLLPVVFLGIASVLYWDWSGDLAPYFAFQVTVFVSAVVILLSFDSFFPQKGFILWALVLYTGAIACEQLDHQVFDLTRGLTGGHAIKHLLAGLVALPLHIMLTQRPPIPDAASVEQAIEEAHAGSGDG